MILYTKTLIYRNSNINFKEHSLLINHVRDDLKRILIGTKLV